MPTYAETIAQYQQKLSNAKTPGEQSAITNEMNSYRQQFNPNWKPGQADMYANSGGPKIYTQQEIQQNMNQWGQNQINAHTTDANAQKATTQREYNRAQQDAQDNRVLEDLRLQRTSNPYSGGTDYRTAMMQRQREITDSRSREDLQSRLAGIDQELNNFEAQIPNEVWQKSLQLNSSERDAYNQQMAMDLQRSQNEWSKYNAERQYGLQKTQNDIAARAADWDIAFRNQDLALKKNQDAREQQALELQKQQAARGYSSGGSRGGSSRSSSGGGRSSSGGSSYGGTKADYTNYFLDQMQNTPGFQQKSVGQIESDIRNNSQLMNQMLRSGVNVNTVIDGLYNARTNGQFPTKSAWISFARSKYGDAYANTWK